MTIPTACHSVIRLLETVLLGAAATASAATWYASPTGSAGAACTADDPGTIQAAVDLSGRGTSWANGDTVVLLSGTYDYSDSSWSGAYCVDVPNTTKAYLTIRSESGRPEDAVLLGGGSTTPACAVYTRGSRLRLQGLTITNFHFTANGVAANASGRILTLVDCVIAGNSGAPGSAVNNAEALYGTVFTGNSSTSDGGALQSAGTISNCVFAANTSGTRGGAAYSIGPVIDCVFSNNTAVNQSGALWGSGIVTNCLFHANGAKSYATVMGGTYYHCQFTDNAAGSGGYAVGGGAATKGFFNCDFMGNHSEGGCGGVDAIRLSGCVFSNNWAAANHGAVTVRGDTSCIITNCLFIHNRSTSGGSGVMSNNGQTIYDSVFIENSAPNGRGGVMAGGRSYQAKAVRCTFIGNSAKKSGVSTYCDFEDCVFEDNTSTSDEGTTALSKSIVGCLFRHNSAAGQNGVLTVHDTLGGIASNCTFIGNSAAKTALGEMPLYNCLAVSNETTTASTGYDFGILKTYPAVNCTFIENRTAGNGVLSVNATNCLLSANSPCDLSSISVAYVNCLYGTAASASLSLTDCIQTADPRLNLGLDPKSAWYAPRRTSPARDAGLAQGWAVSALDLAGRPRLNGPLDIGCYECWAKSPATSILVQ